MPLVCACPGHTCEIYAQAGRGQVLSGSAMCFAYRSGAAPRSLAAYHAINNPDRARRKVEIGAAEKPAAEERRRSVHFDTALSTT